MKISTMFYISMSFLPLLSFCTAKVGVSCQLCNIENIENRLESIEPAQLTKNVQVAKRINDSTLALKMINLSDVFFYDTSNDEPIDRLAKYFLFQYDDTNKVFAICRGGWEWESSFLLFRKNGMIFNLKERPVFNANHKLLFSYASNDMDSEYGIEICMVNNDSAIKMWDTTFSTDAVPVSIKWANNSTIIGCLTSYSTKKYWTFKISLENDRWKFDDLDECKDVKDETERGAQKQDL